MTPANRRAHRALLDRHICRLREYAYAHNGATPPYRRWLTAVPSAANRTALLRSCPWCGDDRDLTGRRWWHEECAVVAAAATGSTRRAGGTALIRIDRCVQCGDHGTDIDHRVSLAVAWARDPRRAWRAWTLSNLRCLCARCHAAKTRADARELANLRRADRPLDRFAA